MKRITLSLTVILLIAFVLPAYAAFHGGIPDNGKHWQVNIIGVPKNKKVDMDNSNRRTLFVPLDKNGNAAPVKINYTSVCQSSSLTTNEFAVLDGNGTDGEATIQVPCELIDMDQGGSDFLSYNVYAVALGKPGKYAIVEAHCTWKESYDVIPDDCDESLLMGSFTVGRSKGKGSKDKVTNITNIFRSSGCLDVGGVAGVCDSGDIVFNNVWIFNLPMLESYYWDYDTNGLKLMQVRFYETTSGSVTRVP